VDVIVNTVCPGLVSTNLGRAVSKLSWKMRLFVPIYFNVLGKSADYGARSYLIAARTSEDEHVSCILIRDPSIVRTVSVADYRYQKRERISSRCLQKMNTFGMD
jgi:hypothetical protein